MREVGGSIPPGPHFVFTKCRKFGDFLQYVNFFIEIDFNGAEVRTLLGLLGKDQPTDDVHQFHLENIFTSLGDRDSAKTAFFAWLYGSKSSSVRKYAPSLEQFYEKDKILDLYWDGKNVYTPFGKNIQEVDEHHALNYIVQSTTAELTLLQALKIDYLLRNHGKSSFIAAIIHDSIIIDLSRDDAHLLPAVKNLMGSTKFGKFKINIEQGKSLGKMRKVSYG